MWQAKKSYEWENMGRTGGRKWLRFCLRFGCTRTGNKLIMSCSIQHDLHNTHARTHAHTLPQAVHSLRTHQYFNKQKRTAATIACSHMQARHQHTNSNDINLPHARRGCGWSVGAPVPRERHHRQPVRWRPGQYSLI